MPDDRVKFDMVTENQRVVLITGASSGIGKACATHLAAQGFRVYATSRRTSSITAPNLTMVTADVNRDDSVAVAVAGILDREGRLDVVINNAGMGIAGPLENTTTEHAKAQFEVNFFAALRVCRAALPAMRSQQRGYIVNIGSIGGILALPYQSMYSASKFALEGMSEALRMEVRRFGIRVVLIEPGDFKTELTQNRTVTQVGEAYRGSFQSALAKTTHDEQHGAGPEKIARLVHRVVNQSHPRLRYTIGPAPQLAAVWLKRLLPNSLVEYGMRTYYGV
jgi:NAD(P)-dependent dehydrogenase (short-subunit alcohol dehydrogenase family)